MKIIRSLANAIALIRLAARGGWDAEFYQPWDDDDVFL
ncbi:hypothetical protein PBI_JOSHKAYV_1 [Mycobacterium phage JoshKayV]|uniref:Uncharacterized protein n=1 Tax=Mycobacterium phage JoshKayV TaxID=2024294 RepID=A0A249XTW2_9CAUD|nr:hypothetical protein KIY86_gp01 [Mycobacterium phage JoshKayV]ASZ75342.1 hypothetical protein PBI_JOSHKAYV_1 [Mycobacterium phage JoshKayV]